jgi:hypothetical protein
MRYFFFTRCSLRCSQAEFISNSGRIIKFDANPILPGANYGKSGEEQKKGERKGGEGETACGGIDG